MSLTHHALAEAARVLPSPEHDAPTVCGEWFEGMCIFIECDLSLQATVSHCKPLCLHESTPSKHTTTTISSQALASQSQALFASLKQLHELMSGPRGKELSPKSTGVSGAPTLS